MSLNNRNVHFASRIATTTQQQTTTNSTQDPATSTPAKKRTRFIDPTDDFEQGRPTSIKIKQPTSYASLCLVSLLTSYTAVIDHYAKKFLSLKIKVTSKKEYLSNQVNDTKINYGKIDYCHLYFASET